MKSLSEFSIRKPATALMIVISMVVFGLLGLLKMPIELMPNTQTPMIRISVEWDGATPSDVEKMITRKIEDILPNVDGITEFNSVSEPEKSTINVKFKYGTSIETKITLIQNEINQIKNKLPVDIEEPTIREQSMSSAPAAVLAIFDGDSMEVRSYAENTLKPLLERIEGVSQILIFGGKEQQVLVEINPEKLENYNLNILDINEIISSASTNIPGGKVKEGEKEYLIKVQGELETAEEIGNIIIKNENGHLLKLNEVANVRISTKDESSLFRKNGKDGLIIIVGKTDKGNAIEIVNATKKVLSGIEKSLPLNSKIDFEYDTSITIMNSIMSVKDTAVLGLGLASIILFIFLKSITSTLIIAVAIPISIIFTFFLLNLQGISINLVSLMGLSLGIGMLVDNSVVVVDNIFRHISELGEDRVTAAKKGAEEMALPILSSTLTTVSVFLPLVFQEGIAKEQFKDMCYAISYSLLASLIIALVFVPMVSSKIMSRGKNIDSEGRVLKWIKNMYIFILKKAIIFRGWVLLGVTLLFIGSLYVASTLGGGFIPTMDEGRFAVIASLPSGSDINMSDRVSRILEEKALDIKSLESYTISGDTTNSILNMNMGSKTNRKENMFEILKDIREKIKEIPDVQLAIVPGFVFGSSGIYDLEFELYSNNENVLRETTERLKKDMEKINDITEVKSSFEGGKPEGRIIVDREKAKYYGVNINSLSRMIQTQILGGTPLTIYSDNDEIDVTVQLEKKYRESTGLLMNSRVTLPNGNNIKISDIARLKVIEGPSKIEKKDKMRKVIIYANLANGSNLQKANEAIIKVFNESGISDSVSFGLGGDSSDMKDMGSQLLYIFGIGVFLIYFILVWQFESFILPFIILLSIPLSTTVAFYGLKIFNVSIDAMVSVGFVMLAGIVVNNAIVLIDFINMKRESGFGLNKAIIVSGKTRFRPILMTTLTTVLGMVPLAVSTGEGSEMYTGMAFVVIFGLTCATILTLVVIPVFYYVVEDLKRGVKNGRLFFSWRSLQGN